MFCLKSRVRQKPMMWKYIVLIFAVSFTNTYSTPISDYLDDDDYATDNYETEELMLSTKTNPTTAPYFTLFDGKKDIPTTTANTTTEAASTTTTRGTPIIGYSHSLNDNSGQTHNVFNIYGGRISVYANRVPVEEKVNDRPKEMRKEISEGTNQSAILRTIRSDYIVTPKIGAYKLHKVRVTWFEARKTCVQEGAHLAVINSEAEEKLIQNTLGSVSDSSWPWVWIGVHRLFGQGEWTTVHDEPLSTMGYMTWHENEPKNLSDTETCVFIQTHGFGLTDKNCNYGMWFLCEIALND